MINLEHIRSIKTLEEIRKVLTDFIHFDSVIMIEVYAENYGWDELDYGRDIRTSKEVLLNLERRMKTLTNHLSVPGGRNKRT